MYMNIMGPENVMYINFIFRGCVIIDNKQETDNISLLIISYSEETYFYFVICSVLYTVYINIYRGKKMLGK